MQQVTSTCLYNIHILDIKMPAMNYQICGNAILLIEIQILFIMNEATNKSIRLDHITKRVNRLLQDKYDLNDEKPLLPQFDQQKISQMINKQQLLQAYEKSERMSLKLKQIRTLCGFEKEYSEKKIDGKKNPKENKKQTVNLKKFVLSMRKKNENIKSMGNPIIISAKQPKSFANEDPALEQYTDASLKYIKSFLPHQTLFDYKTNRQRKICSLNANKQALKLKVDSKRLQQFQLKLLQSPERHDFSPERNQTNQRNVTQIDFSPIVPKWQTHNHSYQKRAIVSDNNRAQNSKDQTIIHYYNSVNVDSPRNTYVRQKSNSKRISSPLDFLAGRTIQTTYKCKPKSKAIKNHGESRRLKLQTRETIKRIVPMVLPCIPKRRQFI